MRRRSGALVLADGTRLRLRSLGPGDRDGVAALFARLSPQSRYRRFLSPIRELAARELDRLTDIDYVHREAVAAIDPRDGAIVGIGRYARDPMRPDAAQIAVEVADELHGSGIGTVLARLTVQCARANGYALLIATTLQENGPSRAILRRLGFRKSRGDGNVLEFELALT